MSTYFRLPLQCMRNVLTSPKKEIPNNIVALSQILHLTSDALNFVSKHSSNTVLCLLQNLMEQTIFTRRKSRKQNFFQV